MKVNGVVTTSSPGPMPAASSARWRAVVPEFIATACGTPHQRRELALEGLHLRAERVGARVEHAPERGLELAPEHLVLRSQVDEGNHAGVSLRGKQWGRWWRRLDSNQRPRAYETLALTS